jgi:hypothetical protein
LTANIQVQVATPRRAALAREVELADEHLDDLGIELGVGVAKASGGPRRMPQG